MLELNSYFEPRLFVVCVVQTDAKNTVVMICDESPDVLRVKRSWMVWVASATIDSLFIRNAATSAEKTAAKKISAKSVLRAIM